MYRGGEEAWETSGEEEWGYGGETGGWELGVLSILLKSELRFEVCGQQICVEL